MRRSMAPPVGKRKAAEEAAGRRGKVGRFLGGQEAEAGGRVAAHRVTSRRASSLPARLGEAGEKEQQQEERCKEEMGMKEEIQQVLKENIKLKIEKEDLYQEKDCLEIELKKNQKLVAKLQEKVECMVCLVAPREGPVPCCPSGHITCSPCLEKLRGEGEVECPTCRLPLGKGRSLLAKVVIEHMKHQCSLEGCQEMVAFEGYKEHQEACRYRLVVCPGWGQDCLMVPFCKMGEHARTCPGITKSTKINQGKVISVKEASVENLGLVSWKSQMFKANGGQVFFLRRSKTNNLYSMEVVMLGSEEECEQFTMEVAVMNPITKKVAIQACFQPRPILATNETEHTCLTFKQGSLAKVWWHNQEDKVFQFNVSVKIK